MINTTLLKRELKSSLKIFMIIFGVLMVYTGIIIGMFDPKLGEVLAQFTEAMPDLMNAFGMSNPGTTLIQFISSYLYGFLFLVFPMIFEIIIANKLVARYVDRGSMAYLLATPSSRVKIITTQAVSLWISIALLIGGITIGEIIFSQWMFPGELDLSTLLQLNLGLYVLHLAIGGICFFGSCISNDMKWSYMIGSGIPILFFLIQMLSNFSDKLENFRYFTIFTLYPSASIAAGETNGGSSLLILLAIAIALYVAGGTLFVKRDLPL